MSNIANMSVLLSLNAAQFNSGLAKAAASAKQFVGGLAASFLTIQTARSFVSTIRELENIGDAAASAGVGVGEYMAAVGELNSEDTQAATTALNKMGKALAELATGSKEKMAGFQSLGLNPDALKAQTTYEALRTIAQAYMATEDPVKKLAIAYEVFGKSAAEVIPILDKLAAQSGEIGGKFAGIAPQDIASAAQAEGQITKLENWWKGFKNRAAIDIVKTAEDMGGLFSGEDVAEKRFQEWKRLKAEAEKRPEVAKMQELARIQEEERKRVAAFTDDLIKQRDAIQTSIKTFGMNSHQAQRTKVREAWAKMPGNTDKQFTEFERASIELERLEKERERQLNFFSKRGQGSIGDFQKMFGQMVRDRVMGNTSFTSMAPTMQRGSAEAGSFVAQFEQRREGVQTLAAQQLDLFKQSLEAERQQVQETKRLGEIFLKQNQVLRITSMGF